MILPQLGIVLGVYKATKIKLIEMFTEEVMLQKKACFEFCQIFGAKFLFTQKWFITKRKRQFAK